MSDLKVIRRCGKISKTFGKCLADVFIMPFFRSIGEEHVCYEFWNGRKFIGGAVCDEDDDYLYIKYICVGEKLRHKGYGCFMIEHFKKNFNHIELDSLFDAVPFYKKMNFKRQYPLSMYSSFDSVAMHWYRKYERKKRKI